MRFEVALDADFNASGELVFDDGESLGTIENM
jgi:hypothetical protein